MTSHLISLIVSGDTFPGNIELGGEELDATSPVEGESTWGRQLEMESGGSALVNEFSRLRGCMEGPGTAEAT